MSSSIPELLQSGLELHRSGRLQEAEPYYQSILKQQPQHPDALHLLGVIAHQVGKNELAVDLIQKAIKFNPDSPDFYVTCAEAYRALGKHQLAIDCLQQALSKKSDFAGAHLNLGNVYRDMGSLEEAEAHYRKAASIEPGFSVAHNNIGLILKETGRQEEAIACFDKAIEVFPGNFEAHNNLGNTLLGLERTDDAIKSYETALELMPGYAEAHSNLGNALKKSGRPDEAMAHYKQAIEINPNFAMAHYNLGTALDDLGRPEDAIIEYQRALAIKPDYAEVHNNLGNALDEMGRQTEAAAHYEQAIACAPDYAEAYRNLARLSPREEQLPVLQQLLEKPSLSEQDSIHCHFALGDIYRQGGNYSNAFGHYARGNALKRKTVNYNPKSYSAYIDRVISVFSKDYFEQVGGIGSDSEVPVFVVGVPRSGTSLVEQIISSHPQVYGAGELAALVDVENAIGAHFEASRPYPECMSLLSESVARDFARSYLNELSVGSSEESRITDKLPGNFLRIGLIKTLFPRARIIDCRRNAMDVCTSNFLHYFAFGNEYSFDLEELGRYYMDYRRLMKHWEQLFPSRIFTLQYEELVMNQEAVSRQLIEYLGLEWDERCLDFHESERAVNTFSSQQVRKRIYTQSVNRWKHYEHQLAPLAAILGST